MGLKNFTSEEHHVLFDDGSPIDGSLFADALHDIAQRCRGMFVG